jgi:hypothetical protein
VLPVLAAAILFNAQASDFQFKLQHDEMAKLDFIVGHWEGTLTYNNNGNEIVLQGYENRKRTAGGTAILVDGAYTLDNNGTKTTILEFGGTIRFDVKRRKHVRFYQISNGATEEVLMNLRNKGFSYDSPPPVGGTTIHYEMNLQADGTFIEIGTIGNGEDSMKLMETRLKKVANEDNSMSSN